MGVGSEVFRPFTLTHALALATIAALIWLLVATAQRVDTGRRMRLERTLASANILFWIAAHGWWMLPPRFDPATSLPLHMCHVAQLLASVMLLAPRPWLRAIVYFWGIGLCTQALLTPSLREAPTSLWFWAFWLEHGMLQAIAVYDLVVRRYRPTWRDYASACAAAVVYLAVVLPIDIALQTDYGFVGEPKPENPSILDLLGPWPQRLIAIVALVAAAMAVLMVPWEIARALRRRAIAR